MPSRPRPTPPRPDLVRAPAAPYGWLDARLLRDGWLARIGSDGAAVMLFLALVADRTGVSFYGRDRMAQALALERSRLDAALRLLVAEGLVAFRPWRPGLIDGVWQLLALPRSAPSPRRGPAQPAALGDLVRDLLARRPPPT